MPSGFPEKAVVLAAGFGTRMRPLSNDVPKPLMPIWNKPALQHVLEQLWAWGVKEVVVNLHHGAEAIFDFLRLNRIGDLRVNLSYEPGILGTGGVLTRARWFLGDQPFWIVNSDVFFRLDPTLLWEQFVATSCLAALWVDDRWGPRTVEVNKGWVRTFSSRNPGAPGTYTFCGLHLVSPRIVKWLPKKEQFISIVDVYDRALRDGEKIAAVSIQNAVWGDIGTPFQYLEIHALTSPNPGKPFKAISPKAWVSPKAALENAVIWDDAKIHRDARVSNAIVGRGVGVRGKVRHIVVRAVYALEPPERQTLRKWGWDVEQATVNVLEPRGSGRQFLRISWRFHSCLLVRYDASREENALYASHARFLKRVGLRVPNVWRHDVRGRRLWLEDLGPDSLQDVFPTLSNGQRLALYRRILAQVVTLHEEGSKQARSRRVRLMPPMDTRLFEWEHKYFAEQFLRKWAKCEERVVNAALSQLAIIGQRLSKEPRVLIHRDLQSSNILLTRSGPAFIDFQGMRWGPAAYDLASLLCDPYVNLDESHQRMLLEYYNRLVRHPVNEEVFWTAAVERLAQALGAFGKLGSEKGLERFLRHIPAAIQQMLRALRNLSQFKQLRDIVHGIQEARVLTAGCKNFRTGEALFFS